ncbi:hypothetical protein CTZ27_30135 [Streptomyces griseocarneus]|nr:hypothetical protein CTZ27_30135 [Streptomyces griseocarneus]
MQQQKPDAATVRVPPPTAGGREPALGPEQGARRLGLRRRELDYLVEAGLLVPSGRSAPGTLQFGVGALDAVAARPLEWQVARAADARRPSPWRELAGSLAERARMVDGVVAVLRSDGVAAWARYSTAADRWTLDWEPLPGGGPDPHEVAQLLPPRLVRAIEAQRLVLLGPVGETMHWAHRMLQPGVAVVLDTETTGLSSGDRVIEVAVVDAYDGSILIDTLVHPGMGVRIPADATRIHGITDTMVAGALPWDRVLPQVLAAVGQRTVLAYNSAFDQRMTVSHARALGADPGRLRSPEVWQCLMKKRSTWLGTTSHRRLGGQHRARGDALAALEVLRALRNRPPQRA